MAKIIKSLWDIAGEDLYKKIMSKDYTPEQTERAYKMFRTDGDELYPLFVDSKSPVPVGEWQRAISGEATDAGKVKSKIGPLAYRPGWHAGDNAAATHIGAKSDSLLKAPDTRRPEHVWAEVDMADDVDWQTYANAQGTQPRTKHVTDTVPYGGQYRYKTNSNMDGDWHIGGDMRVNRVLPDDEVAAINKEHGIFDLERREPSSELENILSKYGAVGGAGTAGMLAAGQSEDADAGPVLAMAKGIDLDRLVSAWQKKVSREPDISPETHLQNIMHDKNFVNYNDWATYARKKDGGKNGETYFSGLKPMLMDISKHAKVGKDKRLMLGLTKYAKTRFADRKAQGFQKGSADPMSLLPVAGVGAAAASLTAPHVKDSGMISAPRSDGLAEFTQGARNLQRDLEGSPMSLLFPDGVVNYLETANRRTEDPNAKTRLGALLDFL
jgi:hypothetical protein